MDTVLGIVGDGYVMLAADTQASRSIVQFKADEDKILALDSSKLIGIAGPPGDRVHFSEFIQANIALYALTAGHQLSTHAAAAFTRNQLANALRTRGAYQVNSLIAGIDNGKPSLYFMDYLASMHKIEKGAHGYGSYFTLSTLDRNYKSDMSEAEGIELMQKCFSELATRFFLNTGGWIIKVVDANGIRAFNADGSSREAEEAAAPAAEE